MLGLPEVCDGAICNACDMKNEVVPSHEKLQWPPTTSESEHVHALHPMLWIRDNQYVDIPDPDQLSRVEGRLTTVVDIVRERQEKEQQGIMEVSGRLATVEAQLEQLISSLSKSNQLAEQRMERMEVEVADRLKSLEALLSRSQV
ncbi:hypothetical protein DXG01_003953 [Tephrocybe rancida]|nr:hypothetical protein DXG01_003953 [Tephrocybe rancida]